MRNGCLCKAGVAIMTGVGLPETEVLQQPAFTTRTVVIDVTLL